MTMELTKDEMSGKADALELLREMQQEINYNAVPLSQQFLLNAAIKRIPWLSKFLRKADDASETVFKIGERINDMHEAGGSESVAKGFHFGAIALAAADFFRIPFIYFAAYLLGEDVPITLNNNARWLYSAFLLALTITAVAVPATAPIIAFVAAGAGLVSGLFLLGKTLYTRYELGRERKQIKSTIEREEGEMRAIQQQAYDLEHQLSSAKDEDISTIYMEIALLQETYKSQKKELGILKNKELHIEQKLQQVGMIKVLDKSIGVGLAALTIMGLVVTLFFPPVGAGILTGVAIAGGVYLAARITAPLFKSFGNWLIRQFKTSSGMSATNEGLMNDNNLIDTKEIQKNSSLELETDSSKDKTMSKAIVLAESETTVESRPHESTADVLVGLLGREKAIESLKSGVNHQEDNKLNQESSSRDESIPSLDSLLRKFQDEDDGESEGDIDRPLSH